MVPLGEETAGAAFELLRDTESMRLSMTFPAPQGGGDAVASLHVDRDGNCKGTFDIGPGQRGDIIKIAGEARSYMRFTDAALAEIRAEGARRGPETAARVNERIAQARGKYLKMPVGSGAAQDQCNLDKALSGVPRDGEGARQLPEVERDGKRVIPLRAPDGDGDMTMYVAAEGKPYIRSVEGESDGMEMELRFSEYGKPVRAVPPPADQVVDIDTGRGGLLDA